MSGSSGTCQAVTIVVLAGTSGFDAFAEREHAVALAAATLSTIRRQNRPLTETILFPDRVPFFVVRSVRLQPDFARSA